MVETVMFEAGSAWCSSNGQGVFEVRTAIDARRAAS